MADAYVVIICEPERDSAVSAALLGRAELGRAEAVVFGAQQLAEFFTPEMQAKLPRRYELVVCGLGLARMDWDGRVVRPLIMDALRGFLGTVRWFSVVEWDGGDERAVTHLIGAENLVVRPDAPLLAGLVRRRLFGPADEYEDALARFAADSLTQEETAQWGHALGLVLSALKADRAGLAEAVAMLTEGRRDRLIEVHGDAAARVEQGNRRFAEQATEEPVRVGESKLVFVKLPPERQPFWSEVSGYAREHARAGLSLCALEGRPVMLLGRSPDERADLTVWARYVTDLMPGARAADARPDFVPIVFGGVRDAGTLKDDVLGHLRDGAHLLKR